MRGEIMQENYSSTGYLDKCPKCKRHALARLGPERFRCLRCSFSRDFSSVITDSGSSGGGFFFFVVMGLVVVILGNLLNQVSGGLQTSPVQPLQQELTYELSERDRLWQIQTSPEESYP